jgi:4a-hydroxytetrahydrobiopterin dehydratase
MNLAGERCEACRVGSPTVTDEELAKLLPQLPEWELITVHGIRRLRRTFKFPDFATALGFTDRVGALAEEAGHHPALLTEWGRVTVTWWTHKIKDLHRNDFVMAARTDNEWAERHEHAAS